VTSVCLCVTTACVTACVTAVLQMYCLLVRVEAGPEPNLASYLVTNAVFLVGFFTLAVLLGECDTTAIVIVQCAVPS
jgi:hypothetical protein